jgi:catechol 2,3-dioxygenase
MDAGYPIDGASDHGVSEAIYLRDPDSIGVELYCDRPRESWTVSDDGKVEMVTEALDIDYLLAELDLK